jgi:predicted transcriptional regulator
MAGRCNSGGMIFLTENIPYTPKMLADELDFEESTVLLALEALERLDMIKSRD